MANHYSYRIDHDRGFAPHVEGGLCTLCGCKKTTIERWAEEGTWVIGIGGNNTGKADRLIYVMKVQEILTYSEFKKTRPTDASYLKGHGTKPDAPVLVSSHFYYFGDQAKDVPPKLSDIIHRGRGCRLVADEDIDLLQELVLNGLPCGKHGNPNHPPVKSSCTSC